VGVFFWNTVYIKYQAEILERTYLKGWSCPDAPRRIEICFVCGLLTNSAQNMKWRIRIRHLGEMAYSMAYSNTPFQDNKNNKFYGEELPLPDPTWKWNCVWIGENPGCIYEFWSHWKHFMSICRPLRNIRNHHNPTTSLCCPLMKTVRNPRHSSRSGRPALDTEVNELVIRWHVKSSFFHITVIGCLHVRTSIAYICMTNTYTIIVKNLSLRWSVNVRPIKQQRSFCYVTRSRAFSVLWSLQASS